MSRTERCHIIWQGYMKNFCNYSGKLHLFEQKDGIFQYMGERNTDTVGYEKNVFNYFVEHDKRKGGQRFDDLEKKLGNDFEKKYSEILGGILQTIGSLSFIFTKDNKEFLLEIMQFSIWKIFFHKLWEIKDTRNTKEELDLLNTMTDYTLTNALAPFFEMLLDKKRIWKIIYSKEDAFFIGDSVFHIRPNAKTGSEYQNNLIEFINNPASNLFFPLSKNIALVIQNGIHPDDKLTTEGFLEQNIAIIPEGGILGNTRREQGDNGTYSETMEGTALYRIPQNCDWYLCGPCKEVIEMGLAGYKKHLDIYYKDPLIYVIDEKTKEIVTKRSIF